MSSSTQYSVLKLRRCCELDFIRGDVCGEVHVLQEHISDEPLRRAANLARRDPRDTVTGRIVRVHRSEQEILRVNIELLAAERKRHHGRRRTRDSEPALAVGLRSRNRIVHRRRVLVRRDDERRARVEDRRAALEPEIRPVDGDAVHSAFPEPFRVDVVERGQRVLVELGGVEAAKGDFAVVGAVGDAAELERDDRRWDGAGVGEGFDGSGDTLF